MAQAQRHSALFDADASERSTAAAIVADAAHDTAQWRRDLADTRVAAEVQAQAEQATAAAGVRALRRASAEAEAQASAAEVKAALAGQGYASPRETGLRSRAEALAAVAHASASAQKEAATKAAALRHWLGSTRQDNSEGPGDERLRVHEGMAVLLAAVTRPLETGSGSPAPSVAGTPPAAVAAPRPPSRRAQLYEVKRRGAARRHNICSVARLRGGAP